MVQRTGFWHKLQLLVVTAVFCVLVGCSFQIEHIFNSSKDLVSSPAQVDIAFEEIWFRTADAVQLHGWYVPGEADRPLVVFFHGNAANISHRVPNIEYLHRLGLPVFIFDYRGFGASKGRALAEEDLYRDARGALDYLRIRGWSAERMIFFGRSMGAAVALQMALEDPPAGVILEAPFTSLRAIARELGPVAYGLFGWWTIGEQFDNLQKVTLLSRPLLILHGDQDQIVPQEMSQQLFASAHQPKTLVLIAGARHSDAFQVEGADYLMAWRGFIDEVFGIVLSAKR